MKYPLMLLVMLTTSSVVNAQDDLPINDEEKIQLKPGLYFSFDDFIYNSPADVSQVEGDLEQFFRDPMNSRELTIRRNLSVRKVEQSEVWGYSDGQNVFLNRSLFKGMNLLIGSLQMKVEPWVRINKIGSLSFIYFTTVIQSNPSLTSTYPQPYTDVKEYKLILNTKDGQFYDANLKQLKLLISDDPELLASLEKERGDGQVKFYSFLDKYNKRHPFQFR